MQTAKAWDVRFKIYLEMSDGFFIKIEKNSLKFRHPSKMLYTFLEQSPFVGAFSQKTVNYFWGHMKDAEI